MSTVQAARHASSPTPAEQALRRFQPTLTLGYHQDLYALASDLVGSGIELQRARLRDAIDVVESRRIELIGLGVAIADLQPTVAYLAALHVLRDLLTQGWCIDLDDEGIFLTPPPTTVGATDDPAAAKEMLRQSFAFARQAQLGEASTSAFVRTMEKRGVGCLFADGAELAERLSRALRERNTVSDAIRPSLELVTPDARDEATGLRLQEVWRYARHFWSIPYQSTPGRNVFYLVRDDAGPNRPIIGIAALGNPILGLAQRDDFLGWSVASLRRRLEGADARRRRRIVQHLVDVLDRDIAGVYSRDLDLPEVADANTVARLRAIEKSASLARRRSLADAGDGRTDEYHLIRAAHDQAEGGDADSVDWEAVALTDLYRRKRASTLAELLQASIVLRGVLANGPAALLDSLETAKGRSAVEAVLRRIKQQAVAENVMEIITCGAVPPYGDLLGGKLVAMLLATPRVVSDVRTRYEGRVSLIASGINGSPVRRDPNLTVLTTSSLYSVGSSQYNRIRIPGDIVESSGQITYTRVGTTDSFGTVHIAPDTAGILVALARLSDDNRRLVNHLFGEGVSPKLRALRSGLEALGLAPDVFLRHHAPRLLYAASLAENAEDVLFGMAQRPRYVLRGRRAGDGVRAVADYWRERWLEPRLRRSDVLNRLRSADRESFMLGREIPPDAGASGAPGPHAWLTAPAHEPPRSLRAQASASEFIERLYRSTNSYADRLSGEQLEWVDVDLGLNDHLVELGRAGKQVIVTGNPGDGKTHLIERLRDRLQDECGALVLTDANVHSDSELLTAWRTCEREQRPMVLAINEWPLFVLRRHPDAAGFDPLSEALRQVQQATYFVDQPAEPLHDRVRVIDLSLRNVLAEPIVLAVIERLTHDRFYEGLPTDDPARRNREALRHPRVKQRLVSVLERVAAQGHHATMRQLVGFIAYLITGGRTPVERLAQPGSHRFHYSSLAYDPAAVGPLFDAVRAAFDPATVTHPHHDADLWRGTTDNAGWIEPAVASVGALHLPPPDADRQETYLAMKRRFYFEHERGEDLLDLAPSDEATFDKLAREGQAGIPTVVRDLLIALNRFFEPDYPDSERDHLFLWQSHRFDVRPPETFMALHSLGHQQFTIEPPRYASWVEEWLPQGQRLLRSFALVAHSDGGAPVLLTVDRQLYLTLSEAQRGLARASWSRSATRKITRFVDRLHELADQPADVEDVRIRNTETDLEQKFEIQRSPARYLL